MSESIRNSKDPDQDLPKTIPFKKKRKRRKKVVEPSDAGFCTKWRWEMLMEFIHSAASTLTPTQVHVWKTLWMCMRGDNVRIGQVQLGSMCGGLSKITILRAIGDLIKLGLVSYKEKGSKHKGVSSYYLMGQPGILPYSPPEKQDELNF